MCQCLGISASSVLSQSGASLASTPAEEPHTKPHSQDDGEIRGHAWQGPSALLLGHGSHSSGFLKAEDLGRTERTSLQNSQRIPLGREERAEGDLSFSFTILLHQICYMLNIWGFILYLWLPWVTAQVGIGMSSMLCWTKGRDSRTQHE